MTTIRRIILCSAILLVAAMPAAARPGRTITGTPGNDVLTGTPGADTIRGLAGQDDITGGKGTDRLFGDEDADIFRWANGDGHDVIEDGELGDQLLVDTRGRDLRLHIFGSDGAPTRAARGAVQTITGKEVEILLVDMHGDGAYGDHGLTVSNSSDRGVTVKLGVGKNRVDASGVRGRTFIWAFPDHIVSDVIRGSAKFFDIIATGEGDDDIRTGAGGSFIRSRGGNDTIRLGKGQDRIVFSDDEKGGQDTVHGFAADDRIEPFCPSVPIATLDTNQDRRLDSRDRTVRVTGGAMTLDLSPVFPEPAGKVTVRLVGRTGIGLGQVQEDCGE